MEIFYEFTNSVSAKHEKKSWGKDLPLEIPPKFPSVKVTNKHNMQASFVAIRYLFLIPTIGQLPYKHKGNIVRFEFYVEVKTSKKCRDK